MEKLFSLSKATLMGSGFFGVCLILYWQSLDYGYIWHDDNLYVAENPAVTSGFSLKGIIWSFTTRFQNNWMPLTWLSYQIEYSVLGALIGPKHTINLVLHLLNGALLVTLLRSFGFKSFVAFLGGSFFLLHPACVESVAWIAGRKDLLSCLFGMAALLCWMRGSFVFALLLLIASLASKQSWVFLPVLFGFVSFRRSGFQKRPESIALGMAFCIAILGCIMAIWANASVPAIERVTYLKSFDARLAMAVLAFVDQSRFALFPFQPSISQVEPHGIIIFWVLGIFVILFFVGVLIKAFRRQEPVSFLNWGILGLLWFILALMPTLGIVPIGDVWRAERFLYPALPGIILLFVSLIHQVPQRSVVPMALTVAAGFTLQSWMYLRLWESPQKLFEHSFSCSPSSDHVSAAKLGFLASRTNNEEDATQWFLKALAIEPRNIDALEGLAVMRAKQGMISESKELLCRAINLRPNRSSLYFNLALCEFTEGNEADALNSLNSSLEKDPTFAPAIRLQRRLKNTGSSPKKTYKH